MPERRELRRSIGDLPDGRAPETDLAIVRAMGDGAVVDGSIMAIPRRKHAAAPRTTRIALAAALLLALGAAGCSNGCSKSSATERWNDAAAAAESAKPIVNPAAPPTSGGALNRFFPKEEGGYGRFFTQEKDGFAEAKLRQDGKDVALASIADTRTNEDAKKKFDGATEKVGSWPVVKVGQNQTSALVGGRYQVKVSSSTLDHEARKALLARFDLDGLAKL